MPLYRFFPICSSRFENRRERWPSLLILLFHSPILSLSFLPSQTLRPNTAVFTLRIAHHTESRSSIVSSPELDISYLECPSLRSISDYFPLGSRDVSIFFLRSSSLVLHALRNILLSFFPSMRFSVPFLRFKDPPSQDKALVEGPDPFLPSSSPEKTTEHPLLLALVLESFLYLLLCLPIMPWLSVYFRALLISS